MQGDVTQRFAEWLESVRKRSGQNRRSSGFPSRLPKQETMPLSLISFNQQRCGFSLPLRNGSKQIRNVKNEIWTLKFEKKIEGIMKNMLAKILLIWEMEIRYSTNIDGKRYWKYGRNIKYVPLFFLSFYKWPNALIWQSCSTILINSQKAGFQLMKSSIFSCKMDENDFRI